MRRARGFTLIELIVSIALTVILIGIIAYIFQQAGAVRETTEQRMEATREVQGALDGLERDLSGVVPSTVDQFRLRIQQVPVAAGPPPQRGDLIEMVARTTVAGQERLARIRYSLNGTRLERMVEALLPQAGGYAVDGTVTPSTDVLTERISSFTVRYLERRVDEMRTFIDPDPTGGPTETGDAFIITGTDGNVAAAGTQMIFTGPANATKLERLDPGDLILMFFTATPPSGFTAGYYTVQSADPGGQVNLVEFPPAAANISYNVGLYPRELQVEARLVGRAPTSFTRNIKLGGTQ